MKLYKGAILLPLSLFFMVIAGFAKASVPFIPCCLAATKVTASEIDLSWVGISSDPAVTGYNIERESPVGGGYTSIAVNLNALTYADASLAPNVTYNYRIYAVNADGASQPTNSLSVTTLQPLSLAVPAQPTGFSATAVSGSKIDLSWTAPASVSAITGYRIERETPVGGGFTTISPNTGSTATTYSDTNLAPGAIYNYRITALNVNGPSPTSQSSNATTLTLPGLPQNVLVSFGDKQATITWQAPASGSAGISGYTITTNSGNSVSVGSNVFTYTITGLTNGTSYTFSVFAVNALGAGPSITTFPIVPNLPVVSIPAVAAPATSSPMPTVISPVPPKPVSSKFIFISVLKKGMRGNAVIELQNRLIKENLLATGSATGYFGVLTEAALKAYQLAHGLEAVGSMGPMTRTSLNASR